MDSNLAPSNRKLCLVETQDTTMCTFVIHEAYKRFNDLSIALKACLENKDDQLKQVWNEVLSIARANYDQNGGTRVDVSELFTSYIGHYKSDVIDDPGLHEEIYREEQLDTIAHIVSFMESFLPTDVSALLAMTIDGATYGLLHIVGICEYDEVIFLDSHCNWIYKVPMQEIIDNVILYLQGQGGNFDGVICLC